MLFTTTLKSKHRRTALLFYNKCHFCSRFAKQLTRRHPVDACWMVINVIFKTDDIQSVFAVVQKEIALKNHGSQLDRL